MRHQKGNKKLSKPTDQRLALLKGLVLSLFTHKKIKTTDVRAKEAKRLAEKLITLGKQGTLHARRQALKILPNKDAIKELFSVHAVKYQERNGGYTRVTKLGHRRGDAATISLLELVD